MTLTVTIPGLPIPEGRVRFAGKSRGRALDVPVTYTPERTRAWLSFVGAHYYRAIVRDRLPRPVFQPRVPLEFVLIAVFPLPKADHRKRCPVPRTPRTAEQSDDADNLAKAVMDAGNGILYRDDGQVSRLLVERWNGAQGEKPHVQVIVRPWSPSGVESAVPDWEATKRAADEPRGVAIVWHLAPADRLFKERVERAIHNAGRAAGARGRVGVRALDGIGAVAVESDTRVTKPGPDGHVSVTRAEVEGWLGVAGIATTT